MNLGVFAYIITMVKKYLSHIYACYDCYHSGFGLTQNGISK